MSNITIALSETAVQQLFDNVKQNFHFVKSGSSNGRFRASYNAGVRIGGGQIRFQNAPDRILLDEIDVIYDPLNVNLEVDLQERCVGGFCIIPRLRGGCHVRAPRICLFDSNPDISIPLNLNGIIQSEISGGFTVDVRHFANPDGVGLDKYEAYFQNKQDSWNVHLGIDWIDFDLIDISDTVGNILDAIIDRFVDGIFGWLPGWAENLLSGLLHGLVDVIRSILDIGDDIGEWLSNLLGTSFGLFDLILEYLGDFLGNRFPVYSIPTPYPIIPGPTPVLLPIQQIQTDITNSELVIEATI